MTEKENGNKKVAVTKYMYVSRMKVLTRCRSTPKQQPSNCRQLYDFPYDVTWYGIISCLILGSCPGSATPLLLQHRGSVSGLLSGPICAPTTLVCYEHCLS